MPHHHLRTCSRRAREVAQPVVIGLTLAGGLQRRSARDSRLRHHRRPLVSSLGRSCEVSHRWRRRVP